MADRLRSRTVAEEIPLQRGLRCFVLDDISPENNGAIVVWREDADVEYVDLTLYLGDDEVTRFDLFGNTANVPTSRPGPKQRAEHHIRVSDEPVFVEGVNTDLLRLLASARIEPGLIPATPRAHQHELVIDNHSDQPLRGRVYLLEPGGFSNPEAEIDRRWNITPRVSEVSLPANASARIPILVEFSPATPAGPVPLVLDLELERDRETVSSVSDAPSRSDPKSSTSPSTPATPAKTHQTTLSSSPRSPTAETDR